VALEREALSEFVDTSVCGRLARRPPIGDVEARPSLSLGGLVHEYYRVAA
jgi:hypothetical protein